MPLGCNSARPAHLTPERLRQQETEQFVSGDLKIAEATAQKARLAFPGSTQPVWYAVFGVELARIYLYEAQGDKASALLREELPAGTSNDVIVRHHLLLGMIADRAGDTARSARSFTAAEALQPEGASNAELLAACGIVAIRHGRLDEAQRLLTSAQATSHGCGDKFTETQASLNLGVIALKRQRYDEAMQSFRRGSEIAESIHAKAAIANARGNLGTLYYNSGDYVRAQEEFSVAAAAASAVGRRSEEVQWLINEGRAQGEVGNTPAARSSFDRALSLARNLNDDKEQAAEMLDAHTALAYLLLHSHPEEAEMHIREAMRLSALIDDDDRKLDPLLMQALLFVEQGKPDQARASFLDLLRQSGNAPSYKWEAESHLAELADKANQTHAAERWYERAIATFHQQRLTVKNVDLQLPFLENGSDLYLDYVEHLIRGGRIEAALTVLDQSRAETLAEGLQSTGTGRQADPRAIAARLHATILVYGLRPKASYLWAITPMEKPQLYTLPGSTALRPLLARHTQAILDSKDLLTQKDSTGRALYDVLITPATALIKPGSRVLLIADKDLGNLNFDTLVPPPAQGQPPHYWIEDVTLTSARSLRLLAAATPPQEQAPRKLLLIGNPIYRPGEFPPLPNAAAEMARTAEHFPVAQRLVADSAQASPTSYAASNPASYSYLHFVAHATANETNPLDSAIILSHSGDVAPYKLYARDILEHPLHADLVTLSSCFGSGTRNYSGEGVVGLVWAFLRAGAHAVIGASWEVSDLSTPQLMDTLYTELLAGRPPDEALRTAKLRLLHGDSVFRKPLYWASFQLYVGR